MIDGPKPSQADLIRLIEAESRILKELNNTQKNYPKGVCLHQLYEAQVLRTPESVAVVFEKQHLTYFELNQQANQLAHYLKTLGVGPDVLVGVFMERSLEMVVALYGILKAGGAYVPLDPEYPPERIGFMLDDTKVPVLITQSSLMTQLPAHRALVICLDKDWANIEKYSRLNLSSCSNPENLAYVIYTSGSTGKPKGVMNCHKGICNRLLWMQDTYHLTQSDRVIQKTPFSFDVSVWEFFWPLLSSAQLIVARPGGHRDTSYLVNLIVEQGITTIHFVPSMLQLFLDNKDVDKCLSLKRVICSGEALPYELQECFFSHLRAELHNLYGPTEAAIDVTYWTCQPGSKLGFVPIGRPIANTQIYILDDKLKPVPIGEAGEIHIGGVQVARGYLNRPELTSERFIADHFSDQSGARLYKTGDLASFMPSGDIKFLGRADNQVKIRGNRVELGEIESVLLRHPFVKQAVVLAQEDEAIEKSLVAYVVVDEHQKLEPVQLKLFLARELPNYMIPSAYVMLEALPLSPNGKIDRHSLPRPSDKRPELGREYTEARDELEYYLVNLWCNILSLDRVGINDQFFELGGTSLQAARFINRLQKDLGENIYITSLFESPTIAEFAAFLQNKYSQSLAERLNYTKASEFARQPALLDAASTEKVDERSIARMLSCIPILTRQLDDREEPKNPPAIFILSPPRSGTTLLRVMLAGHPDLFAASELQLLGFNTLQERRSAYSGKFSLWLEGTLRTIMEIKGCNAEVATGIMESYEGLNLKTKQFYRLLQEWIGGKILVDKSPSYVLDINILEKAEQDFDGALYIHLVRHPYAMVRSFESYHIDQVLYLKEQPFSPRILGELVWLVSHSNAINFLKQVPQNRQYQIRFEDLLNQPQVVMEGLCKTLQINYHPNLITPYDDIGHKMLDGIHKESKPMGDTKFLEFRGIHPEVGDSWKGVQNNNFLSEKTWELAAGLGYEIPNYDKEPPSKIFSPEQEKQQLTQKKRFEQQRLRRLQGRQDQ